MWNCADDRMTWAGCEVRALEAHRSEHLDVVVAGGALEWNRLASFIASVEPTVFHFIGHGTSSGELMVRERGSFVKRSIESVLSKVRASSPSLEGVYLSGCYTSVTGPEPLEFLAPSGGWAVGTNTEVEDGVAMDFAERFYQQYLGSGLDAQSAVDAANASFVACFGEDAPHVIWKKVSSLPKVSAMSNDINLAIRNVFYRAAMQNPMCSEGSIQDVDEAMRDISETLGTGNVRSRRSGEIIGSASFPEDWLWEPRIADFVSKAQKAISAVRKSLNVLRQGSAGRDFVYGNASNFDTSASVPEWMQRVNEVDRGRNRIIRGLNGLMAGSNVTPLDLIDMSFSNKAIADEERAITAH